MKKFLKGTLFVLLLCGINSRGLATVWHTKTASDILVLASWTDPSNTLTPANFTTPGDSWIVQNAMTMSVTETWTVGTASSTPVTVTIAAGASITNSGSIKTATINIFGNFENNGTINLSGSIGKILLKVVGDATNAGTMSCTQSSAEFTTTVTGNFTMTAGTISATTSSTDNNLRVGGDFTMTGGTVNVSSSTAASIINVTGNATISSGTTFTATGDITMITAADWTTGANLAMGNAEVNYTVGGNYNMTGGAITTSSSSGEINWNITGNYTCAGTITFSSSSVDGLMNIGGNYNMTGGSLNLSGSSNSFEQNVKGNYIMTGASAVTTGGTNAVLEVTLNGSGTSAIPQLLNCNIASTAKSIWIINSGTYVRLAGNLALGTATNPRSEFDVNGGATLDCGATFAISGGATSSSAGFTLKPDGRLITANPLGMDGSIITSDGTSGTRYPGNAHYVFNGTSAQVTGTTRMPSGFSSGGSLTIDNAAGVTLSKATTFGANDTLNLKTGVFTITPGLTFNTASAFIHRDNGTLATTPNFSTANAVNVVYKSLNYGGAASTSSVSTGNELPTSATNLNDLTVDKAGAAITLGASATPTVNGTLSLTAGLLVLSNQDLVLSAATDIAGTPTTSNMIVTNGSGQVKKIFSSDAAFTFPVGDLLGPTYAPITITPSGFTAGAFLSVSTKNAKHPNNLISDHYLNRYWPVTQSGFTNYQVTSAVYNSAAYTGAAGSGDVTGTEANIYGAQWTGAMPWVAFSAANTGTHFVATTDISTATSAISGVSRPTVTYTAEPGAVTLCALEEVTYTTQSGKTNYVWTYPGTVPADYSIVSGGTSADNTVKVKWLTPGSRTAAVNYADANGVAAASAQASTPTTVSVSPAAVTADGAGAFCISTTINASGGAGGTIYFQGTTSGGTSTSTASTSALITTTGTHTYYFRSRSAGGCWGDEGSATVTIDQNPTVNVGGAVSAICQGGTTAGLNGSFGGGAAAAVWSDGGAGGSFTDNGGSTPNTATYTASASSGTPVTLTLTASGGSCGPASNNKSLTVNPNPTVNVGGAVGAICQGGTTAGLSGSFGGSATTAVWSDGGAGGSFTDNGGGTPNTATYTASASSGSSVTLTLTTSGGSCGTTSNNKSLTVNPNPTVNVGGAVSAICQGGTTAGLGGTFGGGATAAVWSDGGAGGSFTDNGGSTPNTATYTASASSGSSVTLTLTTSGGSCGTTSNNKSLAVNPNPTVNVGGAVGPICQDDTIAALGGSFGGGATAAIWDDGGAGGSFIDNGGSTPGAAKYAASASSGSSVTLTLTTSGGSCGTIADNKSLTVNPNPTVNVGSAVSAICQGGTTTALGGSFGGGATAAVWSDGGAGGSFTDNAGNTPNTTTYIASASSGSPVTLTLTTSGGSCGTISDNKSLTVNVNPTVNVGGAVTAICQGGTTAALGGSFGGSATSAVWDDGGAGGSFTGNGGSTPNTATYTASTVSGTPVTLTLTTGGGLCGVAFSNKPLTVNPLPAAVVTGGAGPFCGSTTITASNGGDGTIYFQGTTSGGTSTATPSTSEIITVPGTYYFRAQSSAGCWGDEGSVTTTGGPIPALVTVSGGGGFCGSTTITASGGAGGTIFFQGTTSGGTSTATPSTSQVITTAGTYYFRSRSALGCWGPEGSAILFGNPLPVVHTFTGGGGYCIGDTGVHAGLTLSETGISYQLYRTPSISVGAPVNGTGSAIDFGLQTVPGVYYAIATNTSTLCTNYLSGVTIYTNALPDTFVVTGGGSYCEDGAGLNVGLAGSVVGITYQLYNGSALSGTALAGTGSVLDFGLRTATGTYRVIATNATTHCTKDMGTSVTITPIPLPGDYTVTGGGAYCDGSTAPHVGLSGSTTDISYQLYLGSVPVGSAFTGTGSALDFGIQATGGVYSVIATDPLTTCVKTMSTTVTITANPLPVVYDVTGGGTYCTGTTGVHIGLSDSDPGINYQLFQGLTAFGSPLPGTGSALDFGLFTTLNLYYVVATDATTLCTSNMNGILPVLGIPTVVPTLNISTGLGAGDTVCAGSSVTFTAKTHNGGTAPAYVWAVNGMVVSIADSTYSYIPAVGDEVMVQMTSNAVCATPPVLLDTMHVQIDTPTAPSVFILVTPITSIKIGQADTFIAVTTNCGTSPKYQWYRNGTIIGGATNVMYTNNNFVNHDSISVRVITSGACGGQMTYNSVIITVYNVGVTQVNATVSDIRLIPNPNKGTFVVKGTLGSMDDEDAFIEVNNMIGQAVYRNKVAVRKGVINEQIQLDNTLANGMYILNLRSATEHKVFHFVIEQ